jgi:hypothetical protein
MAQIVQCTGDTIGSPAGILTRHADDEFDDLRSDGRSTWIEAVLRAIEFLSYQLTKPSQDGVWLGGRGRWLDSATAASFADDS